jgi:hypothetical protein
MADPADPKAPEKITDEFRSRLQGTEALGHDGYTPMYQDMEATVGVLPRYREDNTGADLVDPSKTRKSSKLDASLSGQTPSFSSAPKPGPMSTMNSAGLGGTRPVQAQAQPRAMSPEELSKAADLMMAQIRSQQAAMMANGPAVKRLADGTPENGFSTELTQAAVPSYEQWKNKVAKGDAGEDYDYRGAFAAGEGRGPEGHMTDKFKKPNHPTFSNESQYAGHGKPGSRQGDAFVPYGGGQVKARPEKKKKKP